MINVRKILRFDRPPHRGDRFVEKSYKGFFAPSVQPIRQYYFVEVLHLRRKENPDIIFYKALTPTEKFFRCWLVSPTIFRTLANMCPASKKMNTCAKLA